MQLLPMDIPAEIHRRIEIGDVVVARGPLVIMAHGLLSLDPDARDTCWIHSELGDLTPAQAQDQLKRWSTLTH